MDDYQKLVDFFMDELPEDSPWLGRVKDLVEKMIANGVTFAEDNNVPIKWIPVTERLPDLIPCNAGTAYSEAVIVWTDGRKAMIAVWDGIDFLCAADYWEAWGENITHWMPLPQAPKGE